MKLRGTKIMQFDKTQNKKYLKTLEKQKKAKQEIRIETDLTKIIDDTFKEKILHKIKEKQK